MYYRDEAIQVLNCPTLTTYTSVMLQDSLYFVSAGYLHSLVIFSQVGAMVSWKGRVTIGTEIRIRILISALKA